MAGLKILGIHGLGDHRGDPWADNWQRTIQSALGSTFEFEPFRYDDIFQRIEVTPTEAALATGKLLGSGLSTWVGSWFGRDGAKRFGGESQRGILDGMEHWLKWYPGYVVGWLENDDFRREVRTRLLKAIADFAPDVVLAHSLGSLISFDAFSSLPDLTAQPKAKAHLKNVNYVTLGSQLGNPFVMRNLTPGRVMKPGVLRWWHLYNPNDRVFTAEIRLPGTPGFEQVWTEFDIEGWADHKAEEYLGHAATRVAVWDPLALSTMTGAAGASSRAAGAKRLELQMGGQPTLLVEAQGVRLAKSGPTGRPPRRRAVLVGINEYANPADNLSGCVNDVFLMSQTLQERGFAPEEIRVVFNERATARGIRERFEWLVEDARGGDTLVFYYSGHGAQLPVRNAAETVDSLDETLCPHDFDWSNETAFTDDAISDLYSQLPYDTRLLLMFDCCHSGGIHRDGGAKARGLTPPDDIRHRALKWDATLGMWVPRELKPFQPKDKSKVVDPEFFGESGAVRRLGRAAALRGQTREEYHALSKAMKVPAVGPFLPLILEACQESELAYEYRHGVTSYGAFTFTLVEAMRQSPSRSVEDLMDETRRRLDHLGFQQKPNHLGPTAVLAKPFPLATVEENSPEGTKPVSSAKKGGAKKSAGKKSAAKKGVK